PSSRSMRARWSATTSRGVTRFSRTAVAISTAVRPAQLVNFGSSGCGGDGAYQGVRRATVTRRTPPRRDRPAPRTRTRRGGSAQMPREEVHGDVHRLPPPRSEGVPLTGIGAQLDVRPGRLERGGGLTGPPRRAGVVGRAVMDLQRVGGPGRVERGGGLTGPPRRAGVVGRAVMDLQRVGGPGGMGQRGHLAPEFRVLLGRAVLGLDPLDDRITVGPLEVVQVLLGPP